VVAVGRVAVSAWPAAGPSAPYERALGDPGFLERVARRYGGRHDLLDALWWLDHPGQPGPSGAAPPLAALAGARRTLYARDTSPGAVARYTAAAAVEAADRSALLEAIAEAERSQAAAAAGQGDRRPRTPRGWRGSVLAAVLGGVALLGWSRATQPAPVDAGERVVLEVRTGSGDALAVFRPAPTWERLDERRLAVLGRATVVGQLRRGLVCLELRSGGAASGACRTVTGFRRDGLEVPFPTGSAEVGELRWFPDGRLRISIPRSRPDRLHPPPHNDAVMRPAATAP
jgi:hypothetical protein